jgi:hypothetical protein
MVRLAAIGAGDCESCGASPIIVDVEAGDGVVTLSSYQGLCAVRCFCSGSVEDRS